MTEDSSYLKDNDHERGKIRDNFQYSKIFHA